MRKFRILLVIFIIALGSVFFFWNDLLDIYSELFLQLPQIGKEATEFLIKETEKQISTPPPLRAQKEDPQSFLTRTGVIQWTNIQREKYGLPPLKENAKLNAMAEEKAQDMLAKQYFSHYSPSGEEVKDLAENAGYEFIAIGENLALGNFENDEVLVQAWMDSPGHRENILKERYQEIGVALIKGVFEDRSTWFAVQHFGLPLSACFQPDEILEAKIEANQNQIDELEETLKVLRAEIRAIRPKRGLTYNQKIKQYNTLVSKYNALIEENEILINEYNTQAELFNKCATGVD